MESRFVIAALLGALVVGNVLWLHSSDGIATTEREKQDREVARIQEEGLRDFRARLSRARAGLIAVEGVVGDEFRLVDAKGSRSGETLCVRYRRGFRGEIEHISVEDAAVAPTDAACKDARPAQDWTFDLKR